VDLWPVVVWELVWREGKATTLLLCSYSGVLYRAGMDVVGIERAYERKTDNQAVENEQ